MRYNVLLERLQNLIKYKPSQSEIGKIIGLAQTAISGRANRNSNFSDEEVELLNEHYNINLFAQTTQNALSITQSDKVLIDYYPDVLVSCGNGIYFLGETKEQMTVPKKLIKGYSDSYKYVIVTAFSDSMQPEIKPNDLLIVRMIEMENIIDNHIYIFCHDEKLYCKYLSDNVGQVIIKSANHEYPTRYLEKEQLEDFRLVGEVCGCFRKFNE